MDWLELAIAGLLLLANAFFVLVEFALVKARITRLEELAGRGHHNAVIAKELAQKLDEILSACQLGITMASLGLGWIGEPAMARLLSPHLLWLPVSNPDDWAHKISFVVAFVLITVLHVVVGELAPKSMAIRHPERSAMYSARSMRWFYRVFYWPLSLLNRASNLLLKLLRVPMPSESEMQHSEEELRILISHAEEHGQFPLRRLLLFENLFDFGEQRVRDVMTPRDSVAVLSLAATWEENLKVVRARKHTRYPLCKTGLDDLVGYVHAKDILLQMADGGNPAPDLNALKREVTFVPEEMPLEKTLSLFQNKNLHMALARGAGGATTGLVTIEDIAEEILGEIHDEFDAPPIGSLQELWVPQASELELGPVERPDAIAALLKKLAEAAPEVNYKEAYDALMKRELALTTAIGSEVALPHARLPNLAKPMVAIGRSSSGIAFDAPDKRPVKLLFMILTPAREPLAQLRLLSKIATLVSNKSLLRRLKKARTSNELAEILRTFDQSMPT